MSTSKKNISSGNNNGNVLLLSSNGSNANQAVVLLNNQHGSICNSGAFLSTITIEPRWLIAGYSEKFGEYGMTLYDSHTATATTNRVHSVTCF
jgi:hypothetical protein